MFSAITTALETNAVHTSFHGLFVTRILKIQKSGRIRRSYMEVFNSTCDTHCIMEGESK